MTQHTYDIAIVGGGLAGLILAALLAQYTSLSIIMVDENLKNSTWSDIHYDPRVSAITLGSVQLLRQLNVWEKVLAHRVGTFTNIKVWAENQQAELHFDSQDIAEMQLGYIIENNLLQKILLEKINASPQIYLLTDKLINFIIKENSAEITTSDAKTIHAKLIIGADGMHSKVRQLMDVTCPEKNYSQQAIITHVTTELAHDNIARQVFLPGGPLAFLPLASSHLSSIVWSLPTLNAERILALSNADFRHELSTQFQHRLGHVVDHTKRYAFPLGTHHAKQYCQDRIALIGDAAHRVHPLAGLGINMGFADAATLTHCIAKSIVSSRDFARLYQLRRYERQRKADNFALMQGIDWLNTYFSQDKKIFNTTRQMGMDLINRSRFLKQIFMYRATGVQLTLLPTLSP